MKICIFGGSFDPPHEGHRRLAASVMDAKIVDEVIWVPALEPPHKDSPATAFEHRAEMARLLAKTLPHQSVSTVEKQLPRPSFSLHTIEALKKEVGPEHAWYFLIGSDNWTIFPTWHRWQDVLQEVTMIVYPRQGHPIGMLPPEVIGLDLPTVDLDSSSLRAALLAGGDMDRAGVPRELHGYIREHGLYGQGKGRA